MALKQEGCKRMKLIELAQDRILQQSCDYNNRPLDSIKGRDIIHYLMITTSDRTLNREVTFQHTVQKMYLLLSYGTHKCTWPVHNVFKKWPVKYYCQHKLVFLLLSLTACFTKAAHFISVSTENPTLITLLDHLNYQKTQEQ